jgi:hypothetical protein
MDIKSFEIYPEVIEMTINEENATRIIKHHIPHVSRVQLKYDGEHFALWNKRKVYYYQCVIDDKNLDILSDTFMGLPIFKYICPKTIQIHPINKHLWCLGHDQPPNPKHNVQTIFSIESRKKSKIRLYDPWLFSWMKFYISYPPNITPLSIDAWREYLLIFGLNEQNEEVILIRKANFDYAGYNPFISYIYNGTENTKSLFNTLIGKFLGIDDKKITMTLDDIQWKIINIGSKFDPSIDIHPTNVRSNVHSDDTYYTNSRVDNYHTNIHVDNCKIWNHKIYTRVYDKYYSIDLSDLTNPNCFWSETQNISTYKLLKMETIHNAESFVTHSPNPKKYYSEPFIKSVENGTIVTYVKNLIYIIFSILSFRLIN